MKVYVIQIEEPGNTMTVDEDQIGTEITQVLKDTEIGDKVFITVRDMPEETFKELPEFTGW